MDAYIGEIRWFGFDYAPEGWAFCDGSMLSVHQHQALYSIIGIRYGGIEGKEFRLPNLAGRAVRGVKSGDVASLAGAATQTLTTDHLPAHKHTLKAAVVNSGAAPLIQAALKQDPQSTHMVSRLTKAGPGPATITPTYSSTSDGSTLHASALGSPANLQPVISLMNPYLVLNACICLDGEYPVMQ